MFPCLEQGELPPSCTAAQVVQHRTVGMELLFTVFIKQIFLGCQETTHLAVRSKSAFCLLSTCSTLTGRLGRKGSVKLDWEFTNVCSGLGIAQSCHWWTWVSDLSGTCRVFWTVQVLCWMHSSHVSTLNKSNKYFLNPNLKINQSQIQQRLSQSPDSRDMMNLTCMISVTWCFTQSVTA